MGRGGRRKPTWSQQEKVIGRLDCHIHRIGWELRRQHGAKQPEVLAIMIHGINTDIEHNMMFRKLSTKLANLDFAFIGLDMPGHGRSTDKDGNQLPGEKEAPRSCLPDSDQLLATMQCAILQIVKGEVNDLPVVIPKRVLLVGHGLGGLIVTMVSEDIRLAREFNLAGVELMGVLALAPAYADPAALPHCCAMPSSWCSTTQSCLCGVHGLMSWLVSACSCESLLSEATPRNYLPHGMKDGSDEFNLLQSNYQVTRMEMDGVLPSLQLMQRFEREHLMTNRRPSLPFLVVSGAQDTGVSHQAIQLFLRVRGLSQFPVNFNVDLHQQEPTLRAQLRYALEIPGAPHEILMEGILPKPPHGHHDWTRDITLPSILSWAKALLSRPPLRGDSISLGDSSVPIPDTNTDQPPEERPLLLASK